LLFLVKISVIIMLYGDIRTKGLSEEIVYQHKQFDALQDVYFHK